MNLTLTQRAVLKRTKPRNPNQGDRVVGIGAIVIAILVAALIHAGVIQ